MIKKFSAVTAAMAIVFSASIYAAEVPSSKSGAATADLSSVTFNSESELTALQTAIKIPQDKELVVDVSLECGLSTYTKVASKKGTKETSSAEASIKIRVEAVHEDGTIIDASPSQVTFCSRTQTLEAEFQGNLLDCITDEGTIDLSDESCLTDETVALTLDTLSANSFNFVLEDLDQGIYTVKVYAYADADDSASGNGDSDSSAWVGQGSAIVDEVRFVNK